MPVVIRCWRCLHVIDSDAINESRVVYVRIDFVAEKAEDKKRVKIAENINVTD